LPRYGQAATAQRNAGTGKQPLNDQPLDCRPYYTQSNSILERRIKMKNVGIIGVGDMGMGMAKNLIKEGFPIKGFDINPIRLENFAKLGGTACSSCAEVASGTDTVFVMVLTAPQALDAIFGETGLAKNLQPGSTVILTSTVGKKPVEEIAAKLDAIGVNLIDSGVSGGAFGADAGTLTMMASGKKEVFDDNYAVLDAVGRDIYFVGERPGMGQVVKACMQVLVGCEYAGIFESLILGVKAGVDPEVLANVIVSSVAGSPLLKNTSQNILDRKFIGAGAAITVYYKDVNILLDLAKEYGVPMFATSQVGQYFQAGITKFPKEDNWSVIKLLEEIVGVEVKRVK
jgi:L-threonate 2-dehydrogenase